MNMDQEKDKSENMLHSVELGDVIQIEAPQNREIHEQFYYVFYADEARLKLLNTSNQQLLSLSIESYVADESITGIRIVSRSEEKGFARQNGLLPLVWVDVHFNGEMPAVLSGEITNLEEDMIEITTYPNIRVIYLDFGYRGIPEDIPIEKIVIRDKPVSLKTSLRSSLSLEQEITREEAESAEATIEYDHHGEFILHIPENAAPNLSFDDKIDEFIDSKDILATEEEDDLGDILVYVEVPESERRYSVEAQVADLLGELLSKSAPLEDIQRLVTRFKQLRQEFSRFDANGNVVDIQKTDPVNKPAVDQVCENRARVPWILPVIQEQASLYYDKKPTVYYPHDRVDEIDILVELADLVKTLPEYDTQARAVSRILRGPKAFEPETATPVHTEIECFAAVSEEGIQTFVSNDGKMQFAKYVVRRVEPEETRLVRQDGKQRRTQYSRDPISHTGDNTNLSSFVFLPQSAWIQSMAVCPSTDIYLRSKLASTPLYLHRMFRPGTEVNTREITDLLSELKYDPIDSFLQTPTHYTLRTDAPTPLNDFLYNILPRTRSLMQWTKPQCASLYSFSRISSMLEPFLIDQDNITFKTYLDIRYYVKEKIKEYVAKMDARRKEYSILTRPIAGSNPFPQNRVEEVFKENRDFATFFGDAYRISKSSAKISAAELLNAIYLSDAASLYLHMIQLEGLSYLTLPENLIESVIQETTDPDKVKSPDCSQRYLAKKYTSLVELQKDNGQDVIFYDKIYDDTPYGLLAKYKDERKRFDAEEFREFFTEKLIHDHQCPPHLSEELADTILLGKKKVNEGEYAVLEIKPRLGNGLKLDDLTPEERRQTEQEAEQRKKTEYYKRRATEWVRDTEVDTDSFLDTNALFCNLASECNKLPDSGVCVPGVSAAMQMRISQRARRIEEFDARVSKSMDDLRKELEDTIHDERIRIRKTALLRENALYKANDYSHQLGKYAASTETTVESPNAPLLDSILAIHGFMQKNLLLDQFAEKCCRPAMDELDEDPHWMYCIQSNVKLLPVSLRLLAKSVYESRYAEVLDSLCRTNGTLSDDGDSIVDQYTGYVLRKIDYSVEEDDQPLGDKNPSDMASAVLDVLTQKTPVFEDPIAQMIYNVYRSLANNMGIEKDVDVEEPVLRISLDMMYNPNIVSTEDYYQAAMESKKKKDTDAASRMPYTTYKNQTLILIVSSVLLVAVQTRAPSVKTRTTFPGCVKSFSGFPMDPNIENVPGIEYVACILDRTKRSSAQPWKSIEPLSASSLVKRMKQMIRDYVVHRDDVTKWIERKREYLALHPEDTDIPKERSVEKWTLFAPPLQHLSLPSPPIGITAEYAKEVLHAMQSGSSTQGQLIQAVHSKIRKHAYGICEIVQHVVAKKRLMLATSGGEPYLENACCNDGPVSPLRYIAAENENAELYVKKSAKMSELLDRVSFLSKARTLFDPDSSRLTYTHASENIVEQVVYEAFIHYGNFDTDRPIPAYLDTVCKDKPAYDRFGTITEKISYMKKHGKNYTSDDFYALMHLVNRQNPIHLLPEKEIRSIDGFKDILEYFDLKDSPLIETGLRKRIWRTIDDYVSTVMVHEERDSVKDLSLYLKRVNHRMRSVVFSFLQKNSTSLTTRTLGQIKNHLDSTWSVDALKPIQNSVYLMCKVFPVQIENQHYDKEAGLKHWGFALNHVQTLRASIDTFYAGLVPFFNSNSTFLEYLKRVRQNTHDLPLFLEHIPRFEPMVKEGRTYYSLYTRETMELLYQYCWLSVLHEYVVVSTDEDFRQMRQEEIRQTRKSDQDEEDTEDPDMREIRIVELDDMELRRQASDFIVALLKIDMDTKRATDKTYSSVLDDTLKLKNQDKKKITDYLKGLTKDDRKVEQSLRKHKLGRWNVGLQKSLFQYDKKTYEQETAASEDLVYTVPSLDTEDLDVAQEPQVEDEEGYDISRLDEDYEDGHFYEEDYAEDRETDF